ncbi:MAG: hypothetical protein DCC67_08930 [Planctomycetota bacterium]|nr:MAG: hypothetical protein DCC67_08930 [Planctomycetota bacterium]
MDASLLEILRCPQDRTRLRIAEPEVVARINRAVAAQTAVNVAGERLRKPLDGGLVREAGDRLYPIIDHIPVMLPDEAIDLAAYR